MATKKGFKSSARSKRKAKRKKIEIKKKEFSYRGLSLEELQKLTFDEFLTNFCGFLTIFELTFVIS